MRYGAMSAGPTGGKEEKKWGEWTNECKKQERRGAGHMECMCERLAESMRFFVHEHVSGWFAGW